MLEPFEYQESAIFKMAGIITKMREHLTMWNVKENFQCRRMLEFNNRRSIIFLYYFKPTPCLECKIFFFLLGGHLSSNTMSQCFKRTKEASSELQSTYKCEINYYSRRLKILYEKIRIYRELNVVHRPREKYGLQQYCVNENPKR